jgi:4-diphosphocytidyl-2-C-methyl-D-erythritol kinase
MPSLSVRAFAKINLGLRVLGRRPDGYHEIRTVYQAISLADQIDVSLSAKPGEIVVGCDDPSVPSGRSNLVYRACETWRRVRRLDRGMSVEIAKKIPAASGLGGASSDAAAAVLALERLAGERLPPAQLMELAAGLGSDVPFFLLGGRALGCGRGEEVYPLPDLPRRHCIVIWPGFAHYTAEAYAALSAGLTPELKPRSIYSFGMWPQFPLNEWGPAENDFERVVFAKWPELRQLKRQLLRAGAEVASLSGSGTAVYAIFNSGRKLASAPISVPEGWRSFHVRTLSRSARQRLMLAPA